MAKQPKTKAVQINPFSALANFFQDVRAELGKVIWPTREQTIRLTLVVIAVSLTIGIILGSLDNGFYYLLTTSKAWLGTQTGT